MTEPIPPTTEAPAPAAPMPTLVIERGACYAFFAYDVGFAVDLDAAEVRVKALGQEERANIRHRRRSPAYFRHTPAPLRLTQKASGLAIAEGFRTKATAEILIFDFGAASVCYTIPIEGPFARLHGLAAALGENALLLDDSRRRVAEVADCIGGAVSSPALASTVEDFVVFHVEALSGSDLLPAELCAAEAPAIAQIVRLEPLKLSREEVAEATSCRLSFADDDVTVIDWAAALVVGGDAEDVISVLEFANVELLEMRFLDDRLDEALEKIYEVMARAASRGRLGRLLRSPATDLEDVARLQLHGALLFEEVNNSIKLLGDQFLARVYRLASKRLHLPEWDASILRKLEALDSVYQKLSDLAATRRLEILEWIVIILIAIEIVIQFVPGMAH